MEDKTVCVVGLGYVGLPLAEAFSKRTFPFLAQVSFFRKKVLVDVRGMFDEEEAKRKGFYYRGL